jgi:hypothetical protein
LVGCGQPAERFHVDLGALDRGFDLDGEVRSFWVQSSSGKGIFKELRIMSLWYEDTKAPKSLIGSDGVFSCDAILILRSSDLPRRPVPGELLHHPRNIPWQICRIDRSPRVLSDCAEPGGLFVTSPTLL